MILGLEEYTIYKLWYWVSNLELFVQSSQAFNQLSYTFFKLCWLHSNDIDDIGHPSMRPVPRTPWEVFEKLHFNQGLHFPLQLLCEGAVINTGENSNSKISRELTMRCSQRRHTSNYKKQQNILWKEIYESICHMHKWTKMNSSKQKNSKPTQDIP